jgi:hypothetical protein
VPLGLGVAAPVDGWSYPSLAGTLTPMTNSPHPLDAKPFDFWLARAAILVIVALQLGLVNDLTVGPRWLAPALELALLIPLSVATAWTQKAARNVTSSQPHLLVLEKRLVRRLAISLTFISTIMNFGALAQLIHSMVAGQAGSGPTLLLDALNIWATNVVVFALWFWTIDRSDPGRRGLLPEEHADFLFPQYQQGIPVESTARWIPGFTDYLFLAYTNATAFLQRIITVCAVPFRTSRIRIVTQS